MTNSAAQINRQSNYQKTRLGFGIAGVGSIVIFSWFMLLNSQFLSFTKFFIDLSLPGVVTSLLAMMVLGLICLIIQLPIDLTAHRNDVAYAQLTGATTSYLKQYLKGIVAFLLGLIIAAMGFELIYLTSSEAWPVFMCLLSGFVILFQQSQLPPPSNLSLDEQAKLQQKWQNHGQSMLRDLDLNIPEIVWVDHGERTLNGGLYGLFSRRLYVTKSLLEIPAKDAAILICREAGHLHLKHQWWSMLASWLWICTAILATYLFSKTYDHSLSSTALLLLLTLVATNFYFASLFIWPALGRKQVYEADHYPLAVGFREEAVLHALDQLSERNLPDESLSAVKSYVFHPIPTMASRRLAIESA